MDSTFFNLEQLIREAGLTVPAVNENRKKHIMLVGTHAHQTTGYSKVTYHIIHELAKLNRYQLSHFGFQKFMAAPPDYRPYPSGVNVYDPVAAEKTGAPQEMGFGYSQLPSYIRQQKPDIVIIYNDAGVVCQFLDKIDLQLSLEERQAYKLVIYLDQVYRIQRPALLQRIDKVAHAYITFTQYWKQVLESQGIQKKIGVLRHGFDPKQFQVLNKKAMRKKHNIPDNVFVILNLNRNTPRKRYDIVVTAFAELVARHPTKPLVLLAICDGGETGGFPLQEIFLRELQRLNTNPQQHIHKLMISSTPQTYTDEMINELYSLSDIGISAAEGEGFGLCNFEAMGVGIPQVVSNVGGMRDFCKNGYNSQAIEPKWTAYLPASYSNVGGISEIIDAHDLALGVEEYLLDSDLRETHGKNARQTVLDYDWTKEVSSLVNLIDSLE